MQERTHESEDVPMQGYKQGHMNLKIRGCKDARIQASTHKHKDINDARMRGYKQVDRNPRI